MAQHNATSYRSVSSTTGLISQGIFTFKMLDLPNTYLDHNLINSGEEGNP